MDEFDVLIKENDWSNGPDRGSMVVMGMEEKFLVAAVKQLSSEDYVLRTNERQIRTGTVDEEDKPIMVTRVTIKYLSMRRRCVPGFVHKFKGQVEHPILRAARFRRYEADRMSTDLDDAYYGDSSCEVRAFARHAKAFAYRLSKIPVAKRRKEALKSIVHKFDEMIYEHTQEGGQMPTDRDENFLMYSVYMGVLNIVRGDCFLTKTMPTLVFSEDTSCEFRVDPTIYSVTYPSRKRKCAVTRNLPDNLRSEMRALHKIRTQQGTIHMFINPLKSSPMTYNALTKWAGRYSKTKVI
jgi:hypothetical protein